MKSLPILAVFLMGLTGVAWFAGSGGAQTLPAEADDVAQPVAEETIEDKSRSATTPPPSEEALKLMQEARQRLFERSTVQATLRETVNIGTRKFRGEGTYVAGRFPKLRLSLSINVGGTTGEILEVCDGTILWTAQQIDSSGGKQPDVQVSRTVISDVTEALDETMDVPETLLIAGLGVGGLPSLLAALERSMTFEAFRELEEDGRRFNVIQGRWSDEYISRLTGGNSDEEFPSYMPDHVRIYFDAETMFPTRILYLRRTEAEARTFVALLSLDFSDIVLDAPVDDELFQYTPGATVKVQDRTGEFLKMIDEAAQKGRAESGVRPDGSVPVNDE